MQILDLKQAFAGRLFWLDVIRSVCAIEVCAGHLRSMMFQDYASVESGFSFSKLLYFATGFQHEAVVVFFVLSGYFVGGEVIRSFDLGRFTWRVYILSRLTRLWTVLIPTLVLTAVVDSFSLKFNSNTFSGYYHEIWHLGPERLSDFCDSASCFFQNVIFLQTITCPTYGSNTPLWSLANEFWYYILFPLFCGFCRRGEGSAATARFKFLSAGLLFFLLCALPLSITSEFGIWVFGAAASTKFARKISTHRVFSAYFTLSAAFLMLLLQKVGSAYGVPTLASHYLLGAATTLVCITCIREVRTPKGLLPRAMTGLSNISFSLYVYHFPILWLIGVLAFQDRRYNVTFATALAFFTLLVMLTIGAIFWWWLFERNTPYLRTTFFRWMNVKRITHV